VEEALAELQELGSSGTALKATYLNDQDGRQRFTIKPSALPDIDALINDLAQLR